MNGDLFQTLERNTIFQRTLSILSWICYLAWLFSLCRDWYFSSIIFLFIRHKIRRSTLTILILSCLIKLSMVLDQATREHCTALLMLNLLFVDNITLFSKAKTEIVKISYLIQYFCKYLGKVVSPNKSKTLLTKTTIGILKIQTNKQKSVKPLINLIEHSCGQSPWDVVTMLKIYGGLVIHKSKQNNLALRSNLAWRLIEYGPIQKIYERPWPYKRLD